jgi:hypothetical protein
MSVYILSHKSGYHAFEDYYVGLSRALKTHCDLPVKPQVIIYEKDQDIPEPQSPRDVYLFMNNVTHRFIELFIQKKHQRICLVNTEQSSRPLWSLIIGYYVKIGLPIYDYDLFQMTQIEQLASQIGKEDEVKISYLPYQITQKESHRLINLIQGSKKLYHVAICSINQSKKRENVYNQLVSRGLKVIDVVGWNDHRDALIAQAQVLLNVHYDTDYQIFEHLRCDRWIFSGMLVVSETSLSDDLMDTQEMIISVPYNELVDKVYEVVTHYLQFYERYLTKLSEKRSLAIQKRRQCVTNFSTHIT